MSARWHVVPDHDWIGHEERADECVCGPHVEFFPRGSVVVHHALDGRHSRDPLWAPRRAREVALERSLVDELPA
jgi:hypothetical protein